MISFVWSSKYPFIAGSGGSESYTAGQIRELIRRGMPARIVTIGFGNKDGRDDFPDIPFLALESNEQLSELNDLVVYITYPRKISTRHPAYAILHCPPPTYSHGDPLYERGSFEDIRLVTASKFAAGLWRRYLKTGFGRMPTVYPFAHPAFSRAERGKRDSEKPLRILFAGRLHPDKGIYTLLCALHMENLKDLPFKVTVTTAGSNADEGKAILPMLQANPLIKVVPARRSAEDMAKLMARHDIVVMPSSDIFWQELFGMISIEAQHAGCRVVASRSGGLPETNIGGVMYIRPDNPKLLANGLVEAIGKGPLTVRERQQACRQFTVKQSVDSLLGAIQYENYLRNLMPKPARTLLPHGAKVLPKYLGGQLQTRLALSAAVQTPRRVLKRSAERDAKP